MTDELNKQLASWEAPAPSEDAIRRIAALLAAPMPDRAYRSGHTLTVTIAVSMLLTGTLMWIGAQWWPKSARLLAQQADVLQSAPVEQQVATAVRRDVARSVSQVNLDGFELVPTPRLHVSRSTP